MLKKQHEEKIEILRVKHEGGTVESCSTILSSTALTTPFRTTQTSD